MGIVPFDWSLQVWRYKDGSFCTVSIARIVFYVGYVRNAGLQYYYDYCCLPKSIKVLCIIQKVFCLIGRLRR